MDEDLITLSIVLGSLLSIAVLVCFFVLCSNVAKLVKYEKDKVDDWKEFLILEKIGEKEKAFYHLKRSLATDQLIGVPEEEIKIYKEKFDKLGMGVPDMFNLNK